MVFFKVFMALWPFIKELIFGKRDPMVMMHHNPTASILAITCIVLSITSVSFMYTSLMLSQELANLKKSQPPPLVKNELEDLRDQLEAINKRMEELTHPE